MTQNTISELPGTCRECKHHLLGFHYEGDRTDEVWCLTCGAVSDPENLRLGGGLINMTMLHPARVEAARQSYEKALDRAL